MKVASVTFSRCVGAEAPRPGLDMNLHRRPPDVIDRRVHAQHVADLDRADEGHRVDGDRDDASLRLLHRRDSAGLVHLAQHPAAEDVAVGVGVARHGDQANRQFAPRLDRLDFMGRRSVGSSSTDDDPFIAIDPLEDMAERGPRRDDPLDAGQIPPGRKVDKARFGCNCKDRARLPRADLDEQPARRRDEPAPRPE